MPIHSASAVPEGYLVGGPGDVRLHFLDWGGPIQEGGVLLLPGLLQPASSWAPVARRLCSVRRTIVADLRGHGLSDAPPHGYDMATLAEDAIAVAEGAGLLDGPPLVVAGQGFGASVAAAGAATLAARCAGIVLVDGGWERTEATTGLAPEEFLRGLDEPPEVLRSMAAWLADRRGFDPATWDADQERAARDSVVETAAGHVVPAVRRHVLEAMVGTMFAYDPAVVLAAVAAPVTALVALGAGDHAFAAIRLAELGRSAAASVAAGHPAPRVAEIPGTGHNLVRHRPDHVAAAILAAAG
jgi:pimeloyl-ACP methyl ester carboxylesterase